MPLETVFTFDEIYKAKTEALELVVYNNGEAVECTAAAYVLYNSGRTQKASGAITPTGTPANTLPVIIANTAFTSVEENCSIEWTFTADSKVRVFNSYFDVVAWKISCNVIDANLEKYYPDLSDHLWSGQSTYSTQIQLAFQDVKRDIKAKGRRANLIVVDADIAKLVELKSFVHIFNAFFRKPTDDVWLLRAQEAEAAYQSQFAKTILRYDETQDGIVDAEQKLGAVFLRR
jgi:hypothetical protein